MDTYCYTNLPLETLAKLCSTTLDLYVSSRKHQFCSIHLCNVITSQIAGNQQSPDALVLSDTAKLDIDPILSKYEASIADTDTLTILINH